jgi:hypothetical protein
LVQAVLVEQLAEPLEAQVTLLLLAQLLLLLVVVVVLVRVMEQVKVRVVVEGLVVLHSLTVVQAEVWVIPLAMDVQILVVKVQ